MSIRPFLAPDHVFDPEALHVMGMAFDKACAELHDRGQPDLVQEVIASRIIDSANKGERDPDKLVAAGLAALKIPPVI